MTGPSEDHEVVLTVNGAARSARVPARRLLSDLLRRTLYMRLIELAAVSVGAVLIAACLIRLRWKAVA